MRNLAPGCVALGCKMLQTPEFLLRLGGKGAPQCWVRERGIVIRPLFKLCIWMFWKVAEAFQATSLCSQWRGCWGEARVSTTARRPVAAGNAHILLPTISMDSPPVHRVVRTSCRTKQKRMGWTRVCCHPLCIGNFHGLLFSLDLKMISALGQEIVNLSD